MDDTPATEKDAQCGEPAPTQVDRNLLLDVEILVSRLVAKAGQLIGNFTTNLAENWMSIRCKFDGGKVINRCQSGSWEHRCMGAGLRLNIRPNWGPQVWRDTTGSELNPILVNTANKTAKKREKDRKGKQTEEAKKDADKVNIHVWITQLKLESCIVGTMVELSQMRSAKMFVQNTLMT